jgi:CUG-BP- and ETR3-like factor
MTLPLLTSHQIPKHLDEEALRPFFDEFGPIIELTVIRDKNTKVHRGELIHFFLVSSSDRLLGCAFLTYALRQSAFRAIQALHDKVKLPNVCPLSPLPSPIHPQSSNPLQIRPAESHSERENKIFVGMLPKSVSEAGLHDMFSPFGQLKEVTADSSLQLICFRP